MTSEFDFDSLDFDDFFDGEFGEIVEFASMIFLYLFLCSIWLAGDTNSFLDDVSIGPSENSYDSSTTIESEDR